MSQNKGDLICEVTSDGTIIEVGGEERCVVVDMGGNFHPVVCGVPVEKLREIASKMIPPSLFSNLDRRHLWHYK